jgi:hypothetical protein
LKRKNCHCADAGKVQRRFLWQLGAWIKKVTLEADTIELENPHAEEEVHSHLLVEFTLYNLSAGVVWDVVAYYNTGVSAPFRLSITRPAGCKPCLLKLVTNPCG